MTNLNTIIEEEKKEFDGKFYDIGVAGYLIGTEDLSLNNGQLIKDFLTTAMQRAYEAGQGERDTYWKERVRMEVEKTRNEVLSRILLIISAKALNETWNAERQLERVENFCKNPSWGIAEAGNMMLPTPITNEDNLK